MRSSGAISGDRRLDSKRWTYVLLAAGTLGVAYIAWSGYRERYPSWTEEVLLSDGRVITVHQKHEYYENHGTTRSWVTIELPELGGRRVWNSYLMPQRVDVHEGKVYVFGIPRGPDQLAYYRYPKHFMVAFIWDGRDFARVPFMGVPPPLRQSENVYRCVPNPRVMHVTLELKGRQRCPPRGTHQELTQDLNIEVYTRAADQRARLSNWKNRSE